MHTMRRSMNNLAAFVGIAKEERDYLGKWSANGSENYLTTAREIIFRIQEKVSVYLSISMSMYDESEVLLRISRKLESKGLEREMAQRAAQRKPCSLATIVFEFAS